MKVLSYCRINSIIEMMRDWLHAAPFLPFVDVLHSGERLRVKNPGMLKVSLSGWLIYDDGTKAWMLIQRLSPRSRPIRQGHGAMICPSGGWGC